MALLDVTNVGVRFGGVVALDELSFSVEPGTICALIGPNGAGKTTLFNVLSRLYQPTTGTVTFDGADLLDVPAHRIARLGLARTFQNVALFPALTGPTPRARSGSAGPFSASGPPARRRPSAAGGSTCWRASTSGTSPIARLPGCRSARSSASNWHGGWRRNQGS